MQGGEKYVVLGSTSLSISGVYPGQLSKRYPFWETCVFIVNTCFLRGESTLRPTLYLTAKHLSYYSLDEVNNNPSAANISSPICTLINNEKHSIPTMFESRRKCAGRNFPMFRFLRCIIPHSREPGSSFARRSRSRRGTGLHVSVTAFHARFNSVETFFLRRDVSHVHKNQV